MTRAYNFAAGPAALPEPVLKQAQAELLNWGERGLSVMEVSHRGPEFMAVAEQAETDFRALLDISDEYAVLFLHGGASMQFSAIPMNLAPTGGEVDYVCTGHWSKKAIHEARKFADVQIAATNEPECNYIPPLKEWHLNERAAYLHYTPNETIQGVEFHWIPEVATPLVADMSSTLLSRPLPVDRFAVIYAGAQKNIGLAGLAVVIVRKDLLGKARAQTPALLDWAVMAESGSMQNTPPTFAWYLTGLVLQWIRSEGGLVEMERRNKRKADKLYTFIEDSSFYRTPVAAKCRSCMNIPFILADADLDKVFLEKTQQQGLLNLKGHRSVGGMRASLYNAVSEQAVDALIAFMQDFEATQG